MSHISNNCSYQLKMDNWGLGGADAPPAPLAGGVAGGMRREQYIWKKRHVEYAVDASRQRIVDEIENTIKISPLENSTLERERPLETPGVFQSRPGNLPEICAEVQLHVMTFSTVHRPVT